MNSTNNVEPGPRQVPEERWRQWGEVLRRRQLQGIVRWLLDAAGPLSLISAQLLYIGGPLLGAGAHDLARLLESDEDTREFARFLESGSPDAQELPPGIA